MLFADVPGLIETVLEFTSEILQFDFLEHPHETRVRFLINPIPADRFACVPPPVPASEFP
jgi:hypothetical protein